MQRRFGRRHRQRNPMRTLAHIAGGAAIALIAGRLLGRRGGVERRRATSRSRADGPYHPESGRNDAPLENSRLGES